MIEPHPEKMKRRMNWKSKLVRRFIIANPTAKLVDIAKACRAATRTVSRVRQDLIAEGLLAPSHLGPQPLDVGTQPAGALLTDEEIIRRDIDIAIAEGKGKILTREERRQRLSLFADHPKVPHASRISALRELEATETGEAARELGPGIPLTPQERIHRVGLMIEALYDVDGMDAVKEAMRTSSLVWKEFFPSERQDAEHEGPPTPMVS